MNNEKLKAGTAVLLTAGAAVVASELTKPQVDPALSAAGTEQVLGGKGASDRVDQREHGMDPKRDSGETGYGPGDVVPKPQMEVNGDTQDSSDISKGPEPDGLSHEAPGVNSQPDNHLSLIATPDGSGGYNFKPNGGTEVPSPVPQDGGTLAPPTSVGG